MHYPHEELIPYNMLRPEEGQQRMLGTHFISPFNPTRLPVRHQDFQYQRSAFPNNSYGFNLGVIHLTINARCDGLNALLWGCIVCIMINR